MSQHSLCMIYSFTDAGETPVLTYGAVAVDGSSLILGLKQIILFSPSQGF